MLVNHSSKSNASGMLSSLSEKRRTSLSTIRSRESFGCSLKHQFGLVYTAICGKYKTCPVPWVKFSVKTNSIEILGDRMKVDNWRAALEALSTDTSTHHVRIKNKRYTEALATNYATFDNAVEAPKNVVAVSTLYVVREIANSVYEVMINTTALVCLELENVLFDEQALGTLISGINTNQTIQHLSLAYSRIGDGACLLLCRVLRDKPNIRSVDLSGCSLSHASAKSGLLDVIKKQQVKRHEECWAHSLRYRTANPDIMHGLRRLTLNDNTSIGDAGVADLFESLKDDFYVKAVDLQNCGLTDRGAQLALSTLMINDSLVVLDVRKNDIISSAMLEAIMTRLYENNINKNETKQWKWTKLGRENELESSYT
ncbi:PREDICTED: centrosomal protein of 78 kDa-like [Diuraphis noxia]|uniref:centrosomal protein of 78 kDa-like n=1 Tax=Diuraphis noxia TaxID=143948 RepID=UPI000763A7D0|nr:PREDICTED: centrosomal protein of 78 kDa-like [Diuraphis noxia]